MRWRLRHAADARHRFSLSAVLSRETRTSPRSTSGPEHRPPRAGRARRASATSARRSRRCSRVCDKKPIGGHLDAARDALSRRRARPGRPRDRPARRRCSTRSRSRARSANWRADDAIFTCDVGLPTVWAARYLAMNGRRRLIGSFWHGSMANAMPQAIGAQAAFPQRQVDLAIGRRRLHHADGRFVEPGPARNCR